MNVTKISCCEKSQQAGTLLWCNVIMMSWWYSVQKYPPISAVCSRPLVIKCRCILKKFMGTLNQSLQMLALNRPAINLSLDHFNLCICLINGSKSSQMFINLCNKSPFISVTFGKIKGISSKLSIVYLNHIFDKVQTWPQNEKRLNNLLLYLHF